jgi:hypothetical protein
MTRFRDRPSKLFAIPLGAAILAVVGTGAALASAPAPSTLLAPKVANVDFRGVWGPPPSGWQIRTENLATGACTGTTDFIHYTFTGCKVTGNSYVFVINYGTAYHSYDSGTISGNSVEGQFHDTNGIAATYSETRTRSASTTKITAKPTKAKKGVRLTYSVRVSSSFGPLRGKVQVKAGETLLCRITLSAAGAGSCKTTKTPRGMHEAITASYAGSSVPPFAASKGTVRVTISK